MKYEPKPEIAIRHPVYTSNSTHHKKGGKENENLKLEYPVLWTGIKVFLPKAGINVLCIAHDSEKNATCRI